MLFQLSYLAAAKGEDTSVSGHQVRDRVLAGSMLPLEPVRHRLVRHAERARDLAQAEAFGVQPQRLSLALSPARAAFGLAREGLQAPDLALRRPPRPVGSQETGRAGSAVIVRARGGVTASGRARN